MYNAVKHIAAAALIAAAVTACSGGNERQQSATALLEQARNEVNSARYAEALTLLDSLDRAYRDCLEQRRPGTRLRMEAMLAMVNDSITANDARRAVLDSTVSRLAPQFRRIEIPGTDGYSVARSIYTGNEMNVTGIQPRVDEQGYFFIAVNVKGRVINVLGLNYGDVSTTGAASVAVEGSEIATVRHEQAAALAQALAAAQAPAKVTIHGTAGNVDVRLDAKALQAFADTWTYAQAVTDQRTELIRRERLARQQTQLQQALAADAQATAEAQTEDAD